jgi:hypothetical protein
MGKAAPSLKGINELLEKVYKFYCLRLQLVLNIILFTSFQSDQYIDASSNNPIDGFALKIETC